MDHESYSETAAAISVVKPMRDIALQSTRPKGALHVCGLASLASMNSIAGAIEWLRERASRSLVLNA